MYGFADGNPINFSDPFGLLPCCSASDMEQAMLGAGRRLQPIQPVLEGAGYLLMGVNPFAAEEAIVTLGISAGRSAESLAISAGSAASKSSGASFIVNSAGEAVAIPRGASGPLSTRASGIQFTGGSGGWGMSERVTGVRIMDATGKAGRRVNYMNEAGQTVDRFTGRTIANSDPRGHLPFK